MNREDVSYLIFCFVPPLVLIGILADALFQTPFQAVLPLGVGMPTRLVIPPGDVEMGLLTALGAGFLWLYIGLMNYLAYWWGGEEWGGGDDCDDDPSLPPDPPEGIDWERFTEEFWAHVERDKVMA